MNRMFVAAAIFLAVAGVMVAPAAAEFTASYYQSASWQSTEVTEPPVTEPATTPIRVTAEPASPDNEYQNAFTEPSPVAGLVESNDWDEPVSIDDKESYDKDSYDPG